MKRARVFFENDDDLPENEYFSVPFFNKKPNKKE